MKKRSVYYFFLLFILLLIQSTRYDFWSISGVKPDLILLFVCMIVLKEGCNKGTISGFIGGLSQDILSNGVLGVNAFSKTLWGYLIGKSNRGFATDSMAVQIFLIFIISIGDALLITILTWIFSTPLALTQRFFYILFGQGVYNCMVWPFFISFLRFTERCLKIE